MLQHGSVLLARSRCAPELPGLEELANQPVDAEEFVQEWLVSLAAALAINWEPGELSPSQRCTAATIADRKYPLSGGQKTAESRRRLCFSITPWGRLDRAVMLKQNPRSSRWNDNR